MVKGRGEISLRRQTTEERNPLLDCFLKEFPVEVLE
jgi:hypothetical protein